METTMKRYFLILSIFVLAQAFPAKAQSPDADTVTVPLTDPSRPVMLRAQILNGSIFVQGYSGKEVIVRSEMRSGKDGERDEEDEDDNSNRHKSKSSHAGLHRIPNSSSGLSVEEEDNIVKVGTGYRGISHTVDLTIEVPIATSMKLSTVNNGQIEVENVQGDIEVSNTNGSVKLSEISGSAVVDAINGQITVTFVKVDPEKSMSFSSLNGNIDVTVPPATKATLKMKDESGEIYSDFDVQLTKAKPDLDQSNGGRKGAYHLKIDKAVVGNINGGGPEYNFKNFNGDIYIRKGK
jgi:hypothetical protein